MKEQLRYLIPIMICQIPVMFMQLKNDRFIQVIKGVKDLLWDTAMRLGLKVSLFRTMEH